MTAQIASVNITWLSLAVATFTMAIDNLAGWAHRSDPLRPPSEARGA